uniref:hypothetical protein n=1 Tax=Herbidospora sakaeratensis TaxID=564415 RepID=UPI000ADB03D2|nr:hypothetical protein [Herbidospora sakaeratensis]
MTELAPGVYEKLVTEGWQRHLAAHGDLAQSRHLDPADPEHMREAFVRDARADVFFVTIDKSVVHYSPTAPSRTRCSSGNRSRDSGGRPLSFR